MHTTDTRRIVLETLRERSSHQQTLAQLAGVKRRSIASCISRLRSEGFSILAEQNAPHDPKYTLVAEPEQCL